MTGITPISSNRSQPGLYKKKIIDPARIDLETRSGQTGDLRMKSGLGSGQGRARADLYYEPSYKNFIHILKGDILKEKKKKN